MYKIYISQDEESVEISTLTIDKAI